MGSERSWSSQLRHDDVRGKQVFILEGMSSLVFDSLFNLIFDRSMGFLNLAWKRDAYERFIWCFH